MSEPYRTGPGRGAHAEGSSFRIGLLQASFAKRLEDGAWLVATAQGPITTSAEPAARRAAELSRRSYSPLALVHINDEIEGDYARHQAGFVGTVLTECIRRHVDLLVLSPRFLSEEIVDVFLDFSTELAVIGVPAQPIGDEDVAKAVVIRDGRIQPLSSTRSLYHGVTAHLLADDEIDAADAWRVELVAPEPEPIGMRLTVAGPDVGGTGIDDASLPPDVEGLVLIDVDRRNVRADTSVVLIVRRGSDPLLADAAEESQRGSLRRRTYETLRGAAADDHRGSASRRFFLGQPPGGPSLAGAPPNDLGVPGTACGLPSIVVPEWVLNPSEVLYCSLTESSRGSAAGSVADDGPDSARTLVAHVRDSLVDPRHLADPIAGRTWVFYGLLGAYSQDRARESLEKQLELLRTIADLAITDLTITLRLITIPDAIGDLPQSIFEVICTGPARSAPRGPHAAALGYPALGAMIHSVFYPAYAISYTLTSPRIARNRFARLVEDAEFVVDFTPKSQAPVSTPPAWGLLHDVFRKADQAYAIEFELAAAARLAGDPETGETELASDTGFPTLRGNAEDEGRALALSARLRSDGPIPTPVAELAANLFGLKECPPGSTSRGLSPLAALSRAHPPFGYFAATRNEPRPPLAIDVPAGTFPLQGLELGTALVKYSRSDRWDPVTLSDTDRLRHTYVIGRTGSGKTNLLCNLVEQDLPRDDVGLIIVDPHGELADHAIARIPEARADDVVFLDFGRTDHLPILNPLAVPTDDAQARDRAIQRLIALLSQRVFHEFTGPRFEQLVRLAAATILHPRYGVAPSVLEVPVLLKDHKLRTKIVRDIDDPALTRDWEFHDRQRGDRDYASTLDWAVSKFTDLVDDKTLRRVLGGGRSSVDISRMVRDRRVLVVKIPESAIGPSASAFIGALVVSLIRDGVFARRGAAHSARKPAPLFVYLDEFQRFASSEIEPLIGEARKFGVGFTLAHQNLEQLREFSRFTGRPDDGLINAVVGNVGNFVAFSVSALDAHTIARIVGLDVDDLLRTGRYQAVGSVTVDGLQVGPFTLKVEAADRRLSPRRLDVVQRSMISAGVWIKQERIERTIQGRMSMYRAPAADLPESDFIDRWLSRRSGSSGGSEVRELDLLAGLREAVRPHPDRRHRETPVASAMDERIPSWIDSWLSQRSTGQTPD